MDEDMYRYSAGLVFLEETRADTVELCNALQGVLEARGQRIRSVKAQENGGMRIRTNTLVLDLTAPMRPDGAFEIVDDEDPSCVPATAETFIGLSLALQYRADPKDAAAIERQLKSHLAELTCRLAALTRPGFILWLRASSLLETADFVKAATRILPRRVRREAAGATRPRHARPNPVLLPAAPAPTARAGRFPEVDSAAPTLDRACDRRARGFTARRSSSGMRSAICDAVEVPAGDSPALRLASWVIVTTVGLFFLPMAILLSLANVMRGEDFRLAAHTMALTGLLMALNTSGALADTLQIIGL